MSSESDSGTTSERLVRMRKWTARLAIKPRVKQRPRVTKNGSYTPKETKEYEAAVAALWLEQLNGVTFDGPIGVEVGIGDSDVIVTVYSLDDTMRPKGIRGDMDNYGKAILDGLNGVAFKDDRQIEQLYIYFRGNNDSSS